MKRAEPPAQIQIARSVPIIRVAVTLSLAIFADNLRRASAGA